MNFKRRKNEDAFSSAPFFAAASRLRSGSLAAAIDWDFKAWRTARPRRFPVSASAVSGGIPIGTILTNVVMVGYSIMIRRAGGPWGFLVRSAGIFFVNGLLTGNRFGFATGNLVEVFFVLCLLAGESNLGRKDEMH